MRQDTQEMQVKSNKKSPAKKAKLPRHLEHINKMAAGIDIGSKSHWVAVPDGADEFNVREFKSFTSDLHELSRWLKKCKVTTVAMESTGVYWIPLYELLESDGFDVKLVDARHTKNVSGRKTDSLDCQWLQELHTYGLLNGAFRPDGPICALRSYSRQRGMLIECASSHIQHIQKALSQMNLQIHNVLSDITGETGLKIIRAIAAGERHPEVLAAYRNTKCKCSLEDMEKSLTGHYKNEHVFALKQALDLYDIYKSKIFECDEQIEKLLMKFADTQKPIAPEPAIETSQETKGPKKYRSHPKHAPSFDLRGHLIRITGVDLTAIPGIEASTALKIISEIGLDLSRWKNSKQFASWLGLCPGNKVSGGKRLNGKTKPTRNKAAIALRMAASTLYISKSALGGFFRRMRARLGAPKATTAAAHKLAHIIFNMLRNGAEYFEVGQDYYEEKYKERVLKNLNFRAKSMGYEVVKMAS